MPSNTIWGNGKVKFRNRILPTIDYTIYKRTNYNRWYVTGLYFYVDVRLDREKTFVIEYFNMIGKLVIDDHSGKIVFPKVEMNNVFKNNIVKFNIYPDKNGIFYTIY